MIVRVRFAPSPTGFLHIGNVRTALFNYLFARHNEGKLILRIEDTDFDRSRKEYADAILRDLKLLSIEWDEGPFFQSERLRIYQDYLDHLEKQGQVYLCYCTQEELEARRREALAMKRPPRYDNRCRTLSEKERLGREAKGIHPTVRFKVETKVPIVVYDLIRGEVKFDPEEIGDFVIMRTNPRNSKQFLPTFHMSVCVDDGLMKITHVIRGEDHLSNSPRHVLLFQALGFNVPKFAHLSLIHGHGGEPLSKRYGAVTIPEFVEERGYLPEALCNYLALLGWSPKDNREVFSLNELKAAFEISNVARHAAIFTEDKLLWINGEHLKGLEANEYLKQALNFLRKRSIPIEDNLSTRQVLLSLKNDIHRFDEFHQVFSFLDEKQYQDKVFKAAGISELRNVLEKGRDVILESAKSIGASGRKTEHIPFEAFLKVVQAGIPGKKGKDLYMPLRLATTGEIHGIEMKKVFELLDAGTICKRLEWVQQAILRK